MARPWVGSGEALGSPRPWKSVVLGLEIAIFAKKRRFSVPGKPWAGLALELIARHWEGSGEALGGPRPWENVVLGLEIAIFSRKTSIFGPWGVLGRFGVIDHGQALGELWGGPGRPKLCL